MRTFLFLLLLAVNNSLFAPYIDYKDSNFYSVMKKEMEATRIMKAISFVESSNRYHVPGSNGEYGAYQFTESRWGKLCNKYCGACLNITIEEYQDRIAHQWILDLMKDYSPAQIASIWNCNSPKWEGKKGVNSNGVKYDVPNHVNKFIKAYNRL